MVTADQITGEPFGDPLGGFTAAADYVAKVSWQCGDAAAATGKVADSVAGAWTSAQAEVVLTQLGKASTGLTDCEAAYRQLHGVLQDYVETVGSLGRAYDGVYRDYQAAKAAHRRALDRPVAVGAPPGQNMVQAFEVVREQAAKELAGSRLVQAYMARLDLNEQAASRIKSVLGGRFGEAVVATGWVGAGSAGVGQALTYLGSSPSPAQLKLFLDVYGSNPAAMARFLRERGVEGVAGFLDQLSYASDPVIGAADVGLLFAFGDAVGVGITGLSPKEQAQFASDLLWPEQGNRPDTVYAAFLLSRPTVPPLVLMEAAGIIDGHRDQFAPLADPKVMVDHMGGGLAWLIGKGVVPWDVPDAVFGGLARYPDKAWDFFTDSSGLVQQDRLFYWTGQHDWGKTVEGRNSADGIASLLASVASGPGAVAVFQEVCQLADQRPDSNTGAARAAALRWEQLCVFVDLAVFGVGANTSMNASTLSGPAKMDLARVLDLSWDRVAASFLKSNLDLLYGAGSDRVAPVFAPMATPGGGYATGGLIYSGPRGNLLQYIGKITYNPSPENGLTEAQMHIKDAMFRGAGDVMRCAVAKGSEGMLWSAPDMVAAMLGAMSTPELLAAAWRDQSKVRSLESSWAAVGLVVGAVGEVPGPAGAAARGAGLATSLFVPIVVERASKAAEIKIHADAVDATDSNHELFRGWMDDLVVSSLGEKADDFARSGKLGPLLKAKETSLAETLGGSFEQYAIATHPSPQSKILNLPLTSIDGSGSYLDPTELHGNIVGEGGG